MVFNEFCETVEKARRQRPVLFGLPSDSIPSDEAIAQTEALLQITLPESYKAFLKTYGGGCFGFLLVYSCDPHSRHSLTKNVTAEWIQTHAFLPAVDFETGDLGGFLVEHGSCTETIGIYDHEANAVLPQSSDFFTFLTEHGLHAEHTTRN